MSDLKMSLPQQGFNSLLLQMLLDIKSAQYVMQKKLSEQIANEHSLEVLQVFDQLEKEASEFRSAYVSKLYEQYGEIHPEILELLRGKDA